MGAELSLLAPTTAVAIQSYVDILPDIQYSKTINSSRFLKTCKGLDSNGSIVVKVLIKPDNMDILIDYGHYVKQLEYQQQILFKLSNVTPYSRIIDTDRACYLVRPVIKTNLYDRISTRPFLEKIEKKWVIFQLLNALNQCHLQNIIHGDLKLENILLTSWNWCLISDFALFKPIHLPEDNPTQFSFYFDTNRRHTCYLAPERFLSKDDDIPTNKNLTSQMDVFSLGCIFAELVLEGSSIFTLSQLFKYKKNEYKPNLNGIDDPHLKEMILNMIDLNPLKRMSCKEILIKYKDIIFPGEFYDFVYPYMKYLSEPSNDNYNIDQQHNKNSNTNKKQKRRNYDRFHECDLRIERIYNDFSKISKLLGFETDNNLKNNFVKKDDIHSIQEDTIPIKLDLPGLYQYTPKPAGQTVINSNSSSLIFLDMVLSSIRNTTHSSFRIRACDLIIALSEKIHDEAKLDRCLPYLMVLLDDPSTDVQVASLRGITQLLYMVDTITVVNISIFQEYILPKLQNFYNHHVKNSNYLKLIFATYLPHIANISLKFYQITLNLKKNITTVEPSNINGTNFQQQVDPVIMDKLFDKNNLTNDFKNFVSLLLTDPNPNVKMALLKNIAPLCMFFGKDKTNDLILSHLITYLNDKHASLRISFIESILPIVMFTGITSLEHYILPLLVQTLNDPEEIVVLKILQTFNRLIKLGFIKKQFLWDLVKNTTKLILHPNEWIRQESLLIIITISENIELSDLFCILYPIILPFLKFDISSFNYDTLLKSLQRPISRSVYNLSINWSLKSPEKSSLFWQKVEGIQQTDSFGNTGLSFMKKNVDNGNSTSLSFSLSRNNNNDSMVVDNSEIPLSQEDKNWVEKLKSSGLEEADLWKIATMRDYIYRVARLNQRMNYNSGLGDSGDEEIIVEIQKLGVLPKNIFFDVVHKSEIVKKEYLKVKNNTNNNMTLPLPININKTKNNASENYNSSPQPSIAMSPNSIMFGNARKAAPSIHEDRENAFGKLETSNDASSIMTKTNGNNKSQEIFTVSSLMESDPGLSQNIVTTVTNSYSGRNPYILKYLNSIEFEPLLDDFVEFGPPLSNLGNHAANTSQQRSQAQSHYPASIWNPKGILVAHLIEHKGNVECIAVSPDNNYFISGGNDCTIKIWDALRLERNVTGSSSLSVNLGSPVKCIKFIKSRDCFAVSTQDGFIKLFRVDFERNGKNRYNKLTLIREYEISKEDGAYALEMEFLVDNSKSLLVFITPSSKIIALDIRRMTLVFSLQNDLSHGVPTTFCVDNKQTWLLLGTSSGIMNLWDLRFEIHLKSFFLTSFFKGSAPNKNSIIPINKLKICPKDFTSSKKNRYVVVTGGNKNSAIGIIDVAKFNNNETFDLSFYNGFGFSSLSLRDEDDNGNVISKNLDIGNGERADLLNQTMTAMTVVESLPIQSQQVSSSYKKSLYIVTASHDRKLVFWNISNPEYSKIIIGNMNDDQESSNQNIPTFSANAVDQGLTIFNIKSQSNNENMVGSDDNKKSSKKRISLITQEQLDIIKNHHDLVTDIISICKPYEMIISADRSGVINVY
ncbi:hypothetical protein PACTADRAFT_48318, partial [Pachysolen tannophilus NRRL Y-2460]